MLLGFRFGCVFPGNHFDALISEQYKKYRNALVKIKTCNMYFSLWPQMQWTSCGDEPTENYHLTLPMEHFSIFQLIDLVNVV